MPAPNTAIDLRGVTKSFGSLTAVDDLHLTIPRGALYGFIGPNGAGKTTAIRMIMSILLPDSGELRVLGRPSALEAKDRIGYLPEERGLFRKMKVAPYLMFIARLKGVPERDLRDRVHAAWEVWLSIGRGVAGVFGAVWFSAKVFRIGILMFGKPPDVKTLIRWLRAA